MEFVVPLTPSHATKPSEGIEPSLTTLFIQAHIEVRLDVPIQFLLMETQVKTVFAQIDTNYQLHSDVKMNKYHLSLNVAIFV